MASAEKMVEGYSCLKKMMETPSMVLYEAMKNTDNTQVLVKVHVLSAVQGMMKLSREYEHLKGLNHSSFPRPLELTHADDGYALILEDNHWRSIDSWAEPGNLEFSEFITLAVQLVDALKCIHESGMVHGRLSPEHILVNDEMKLGLCGLSSMLSSGSAQPSGSIDQNCAKYRSPEQLLDAKSRVDERSDIYLLGIVFYQWLTNRHPLSVSDGDYQYAHINVPAQVLEYDFNEKSSHKPLEARLKSIVATLLEKRPEMRYQTANGLLDDLRALEASWRTGAALRPMASFDSNNQFKIPADLYGRAEIIDDLQSSLLSGSYADSYCQLVSGASGVGKSRLVSAVLSRLSGSDTVILSAKFDQYNQDKPYSELLVVIKQLINNVLKKQEHEIAEIGEKINSALGVNGGVLLTLIPELSLVTGELPVPVGLDGKAATSRFCYLFGQLLRVILEEDLTTIIFLDDVHWANLSTLNIIEEILIGHHPAKLNWLLVSRPEGFEKGHILSAWLKNLEINKVDFRHLEIPPLELIHTVRFIAATLRCDEASAAELADVVQKRTLGNPQFTAQLLILLHQKHCFEFDSEKRCWLPKIHDILNETLPEHAVGLMQQRLDVCDAELVRALGAAACDGHTFAVSALEVILSQDASVIEQILQQGVSEGFIRQASIDSTNVLQRQEKSYSFTHDIVQQAAYACLTEGDRLLMHLALGKAKWANQLTQATSYEAVEHLVFAESIIEDNNWRLQIAQRCEEIIPSTVASGATTVAKRLAIGGLRFLGESRQAEHNALCFSLALKASDIALTLGDYEEFETLAAFSLERADGSIDEVSIHELQVLSLLSQNRQAESIELGIEALSKLGLYIPSEPKPHEYAELMGKTKRGLGGNPEDIIMKLPRCTDQAALAIMRLLKTLAPAVHQNAPHLHLFLSCEMVNVSLEYGNCEESAFGYALHGATLLISESAVEEGYRYGQIAQTLADRLDATTIKSRVRFLNCILLGHWRNPIDAMIPTLRATYEEAMQVGDIAIAGYALCWQGAYSLWSGQPLQSLKVSMEENIAIIGKMHQYQTYRWASIYLQFVCELLNEEVSKPDFSGPYFYEEDMEELHADGDAPSLFRAYFCKTLLAFFLEDKRALEYMREAEKFIFATAWQYEVPLFYFFKAILLMKNGPSTSKSALKDIEFWRENSSHDHQHRWLLADAESNYLHDRSSYRWIKMYEEALSMVGVNNFRIGFMEKSFVDCLTGSIEKEENRLQALGLQALRKEHVTHCFRNLLDWQAKFPLRRLMEKHSEFVPLIAQGDDLESSMQDREALAIVKATQTLSKNLEIASLCEELLPMLLKLACADRAVLIQHTQGNFRVIAVSETQGSTVDTQVYDPPISASQVLPDAVLRFAVNTRKEVVVNEGSFQDSMLLNDDVGTHGARSAMCIPLIGKQLVTDLIYLENRSQVNVFSELSKQIVIQIAKQTAISLANSRLYGELADHVLELEEFNKLSSHDLREPLRTLSMNVQMLEMQLAETESVDCKRTMQEILGSAERMNRRVLAVQQLIDANQTPLQLESIDLEESLQCVLEDIGETVEASKATIESDLCYKVFGDRVSVERILKTLVCNAIVYCSETPAIRLSTTLSGGEVTLTVSDNGVGMSETDCQRAFKPFNAINKRSQNDVIIGNSLAVCQRLVKRMGGVLTVRSVEGEGSEFGFSLSAAESKYLKQA